MTDVLEHVLPTLPEDFGSLPVLVGVVLLDL